MSDESPLDAWRFLVGEWEAASAEEDEVREDLEVAKVDGDFENFGVTVLMRV